MFKLLPEEIENKIWRSVHEMLYVSSMKEILNNISIEPSAYWDWGFTNRNPECVYRRYEYSPDDSNGLSELICHKTYFIVYKMSCKYDKNHNQYREQTERTRHLFWYKRNSILSDYECFHKRYNKEIISYLNQNEIPIPKNAKHKTLQKLLLTF